MKFSRVILIVGLVLIVLIILGAIRKNKEETPKGPVCGDGICSSGENCLNDCSEVSDNSGNNNDNSEEEDYILPGDYEYSLTHDGIERKYFVHVPQSYDGSLTPVVLNFHGGGADAQNQMAQSQMNDKSDEAGFILVYPQGTGPKLAGKTFGTWNTGRCCGSAEENNVDDIGFVSAMIDDLSSKFNVDEKKVYATGLSNGALFSYRLACELSDKIAAIAPVGAQDAEISCSPTRKVPVMHFHGIDDPSSPYEGGQCGGRSGDPGWSCRSVQEYLRIWSERDGCSSNTEVIYQNGGAECIEYQDCQDNSEVILCSMEDAGHTWPGGQHAGYGEAAVGKISRDISANDEMWTFFQRHALN